MLYELEFVQHMILFDAADHANQEISNENFTYKNGQPAMLMGEIFRADPVQSTKGGMCLSIDEHVTASLSAGAIRRLHEIGVKALHDALVENQDKFVGLILGEAREGRNYFDRFPPNDPPGRPGQGRLF